MGVENRQHKGLKGQERLIEKLVDRAKTGDVDAYAQIYDLFITPIYRYIYYRVPPTEVEDLTEVVFMKAWENIRSYKSKTDSNYFSSWVFRIAHNIVVDFYRVSRTNEELHEDIADERHDADARKMVRDRLNSESLREALSRIPNMYQQIVILKFIEDFSNKEVARILKKPEAGVRILQFRALRALRKELEHMGITDFHL